MVRSAREEAGALPDLQRLEQASADRDRLLNMNMPVDVHRVIGELEQLAKFSDAEPSAVTRVVFTAADLRAREWLTTRLREAHLEVREDAVGNTFARWHGTDGDLSAIGTGSHIDAIPISGRFDGT